tara:strand:+ start:519 stop:2708 length:2190 start_codon:yes stop_codon:yes gene_type:complete
MRIIFKTIFFLTLVLLILITYLSIFGIETSKFNQKIQSKIKEINSNLSVEIKDVKLILNPLNLNLSIKTIGPKIINKKKSLDIQTIETNISLKSLLYNEFLIEKVEISTKSIEIDNLISFTRSIYKVPELIFLEKLLKIKGYLIADIKLEFDENGNLKDNYTVNGYVKEMKLKTLNDSNIDKINFFFKITKENFIFEAIKLRFKNYILNSEIISVKKNKGDFLVNGNFKNDIIELNVKDLELLKDSSFFNIDFSKVKFSSKNNFSFKVDKKFKFKDKKLISKIQLHEAKILNNLSLNGIFPEIKKEISLLDNEINLDYRNNFFLINGNGKVLIQKTEDLISYKFKKDRDRPTFETLLKIRKNPFLIELLNYEKNKDEETILKLNGYIDKNENIYIKKTTLNEVKNKIEINDIHFDANYRLIGFGNTNLNYLDKDKQKNLINIRKKKENYILDGIYFNADSLLKKILFENSDNRFFNKNFNIDVQIENVRLDNEFLLRNFNGNLNFKNGKLSKGNLNGKFSDNKEMNYSVNTRGEKKITTLFIDYARPIVKRYKFIKGFDGGVFDFYSSKVGNVSNSTLKIYDFKLKELPTLTKILTLASLQGIADILSGEGIRFDELEMNFKNNDDLMNINEIYAIGPAISVLMEGYIEKNKLISLRGTLVPATTINKAIGSIPVLGKILVGSKTGEGVFGVSFKIKGPPKNLETSVNPIKTLTPRFITRTLEKIKKAN